MSLVNNSANNFKDFLDAIKPYLNYQFYDLSGQGVEANNFSTDEKVIGTWIDGKPLYQKTVNCGALPNATTKTVAHDISNIDIIYVTSGIAYSNNKNSMVTIPNAHPLGVDKTMHASANRTDVVIATGTDRSELSNSYVTLQYTKTTDSAVASGEKIVGQWIDGKPVFEKVISLQSMITLTVSQWNDFCSVSDLNIDKLLYGETLNIENEIPSTAYRIYNNKLQLYSYVGFHVDQIIIRYTKSS